MEAPLPSDEDERLAQLEAYGILDTEPEDAFDAIARLASQVCQTPVALVTLIDEDRQWYKACIGVDTRETDRSLSVCAHAILQPETVTHIPDLTQDERTSDNPQVTGEPEFRFYAGAPITTPKGYPLGTVCVLDHEPRRLDEDQLAALQDLALQASSLIEERYGAASSEQARAFLSHVLDAFPDHVAILDEAGTIVATNEGWDRFARATGADPGPGGDYLDAARTAAIDGDQTAKTALKQLEALLAGETEQAELEYPCHGPEEQRWFRMTATPFDAPGLDGRHAVVAHRDITQATLDAQARDRYQALLDRITTAIPQVLWLVDADAEELLFTSPDTPAFWGLPADRVREDPMAWTEVVHPEDLPRVMEDFAQDMQHLTEDPTYQVDNEFRIIHGETGQTRWIRTQVVPIVEDGDVVQVAGVCEDVTERTERDRERERLASIVEASPVGIGWGEPEGEVAYMNPSLRDLVELPEDEEGAGHEWATFLPSETLDRLLEESLPAAVAEGYWQGETELLTLDGERVDVEATLIAHTDTEGTVDWLSVICRDIRAQKAARRALEESEERFRELAEHVDEVFWMINPSVDEVLYVSPGFQALTGRAREEMYDSAQTLVSIIHPEDQAAVMDDLANVAEGSQDVRYRIVRPDGTVRRVETRVFPVLDEAGEMRRIVGVTRDVTEEEQAQGAERRRARERARSVELEQLIFATSHTLRTQVRRITSFGQLLRQRAGADLEDRLAEPVDEMLAGSQSLEALHDALREYGEATRGRGVPERVDLERLTREVLAERASELEGPGGQATVEEIPPVEGHPDQLRTLIAELVDNAIQFRGDPPLALSISARDRGETVEVDVRDNGIGFDPAYSEIIFGIFQQLNPGTTDGVGIGLTICRRIVENHGGTIRADATPGEGATFTFTLPSARRDR